MKLAEINSISWVDSILTLLFGPVRRKPYRKSRKIYHGTSRWNDLEAMSPDLADAISSVSKAIRKNNTL